MESIKIGTQSYELVADGYQLQQDVSDYGYPISLGIGLKQPQLENNTFKNSVSYLFQSGVPAVILS